jgi:hypothetical protein
MNTLGCQQDTMSQQDYWEKGLHVFFARKTFSHEWILEQFFL